jgi:hypothetical protein
MRRLPDLTLYTQIDACLDFCRTLPSTDAAAPEPSAQTPVHFFWQGAFSAKAAFGLRSFLTTQDLTRTPPVLWLENANEFSRGAENPHLAPLLPLLTLRHFDVAREVQDTPFASSGWCCDPSKPAAASDVARLVILYRHGGIYSDLDAVFLRGLTPLLRLTGEAEFVFQWSAEPRATHAFCRVHRESAVSRALMARANAARSAHPAAMLDYGEPLPELLVLPSPFFSPLWLQVDGHGASRVAPFRHFADFFRRFGWWFKADAGFSTPETFFPGAFTYHWHGLWRAGEHRASYAGLLDVEFDRRLRLRFPALPPFAGLGERAST